MCTGSYICRHRWRRLAAVVASVPARLGLQAAPGHGIRAMGNVDAWGETGDGRPDIVLHSTHACPQTWGK